MIEAPSICGPGPASFHLPFLCVVSCLQAHCSPSRHETSFCWPHPFSGLCISLLSPCSPLGDWLLIQLLSPNHSLPLSVRSSCIGSRTFRHSLPLPLHPAHSKPWRGFEGTHSPKFLCPRRRAPHLTLLSRNLHRGSLVGSQGAPP